MTGQVKQATHLIDKPEARRVKKHPDIGHGDQRQNRGREIRHAQKSASAQLAVNPQRHNDGERNRDRYRAERVPEIIPQHLPEDIVFQHE